MNDLVRHLNISRSSLHSTFPKDEKELYDKALALYRGSNNQGPRQFIE